MPKDEQLKLANELAEKLRTDAYHGLPTMWADIFRQRVDYHMEQIREQAKAVKTD